MAGSPTTRTTEPGEQNSTWGEEPPTEPVEQGRSFAVAVSGRWGESWPGPTWGKPKQYGTTEGRNEQRHPFGMPLNRVGPSVSGGAGIDAESVTCSSYMRCAVAAWFTSGSIPPLVPHTCAARRDRSPQSENPGIRT